MTQIYNKKQGDRGKEKEFKESREGNRFSVESGENRNISRRELSDTKRFRSRESKSNEREKENVGTQWWRTEGDGDCDGGTHQGDVAQRSCSA